MQYLIALLTLALTIFYVYRIQRGIKGKRKWIYYEVIYNCFIKFFIAYVGLPSFLNYVSDAILVLLLLLELPSKRSSNTIAKPRPNAKGLRLFISIYFVATIFSYVVNQYSILQYLWGFRNNFRFLLFALLCCKNLKKKDIETMFDILSGYFFINIIAVTYEFFFSGVRVRVGDTISGLYSMGLEQGGGNGPLNWILCIICIYAIAKYLSKEKSLGYLVYAIAGSVYMAALSELKIFFVELVLIIIFVIAFSKKSLKIGIIGAGGLIAIYFGVNAIYRYFPQFANFFNLDTMMNYLSANTGYQGIGTINRLSSMNYVFGRFLQSPLQRLFGIGFGNADYSSFSFLQSSFYSNYSWTLYQFFYAPFVLIETGIFGLISFISIFVSYLFKGIKANTTNNTDASNRVIAIIIAALSIAMVFYNQSLKIETSGYMVHALCVIPFIINADDSDDYNSLVRLKVKIRHG